MIPRAFEADSVGSDKHDKHGISSQSHTLFHDISHSSWPSAFSRPSDGSSTADGSFSVPELGGLFRMPSLIDYSGDDAQGL